MTGCMILALVILNACGQSPEPKSASTAPDYYVAAYVWPSCHNDPKAQELLWSDGIGE